MVVYSLILDEFSLFDPSEQKLSHLTTQDLFYENPPNIKETAINALYKLHVRCGVVSQKCITGTNLS
jgi:hypothetical protein